MTTPGRADVPGAFRDALRAIGSTRLRPEVVLREIPAPRRIAPFAVALEASVHRGGHDADDEVASGRFIVLHDPAGQEAWDGTFRVVTLVRTVMEPDMAADPLLAEVAWTWLEDALDGVDAHATGGTITRVVSESFGALAGRDADVELEARTSWTPGSPDLGPHLSAWATFLCAAAGLPPLPDGVSAFRPRRETMGS
ncbi:Protein of unknown function (DUF3000) [Sediminihabitans luteus]|uniref:DUF3000 family protein n=1 Tax=Sediminihabitans luteus TaxID=1138585 RepID=A0A2M9CQE0_9CELL|nr:DUF3000 domain-containing protein [Sediminihabitans luteus]PJJ74109.1 Protein of unknown function (DUF3000) [Sediminihabitans luteus]